MRIGNTEIRLVYSCFHTGTWFVVNLLCSCYKDYVNPVIKPNEFYIEGNKVAGRSDAWISKHIGKRGEELPVDKIDMTWLRSIFDKIPADEYKHLQLVVLQFHHLHGSDKHFFNSLCKYKPEIPIVVPVRDPLLSLNSLYWREFKSLDNLLRADVKKRRSIALLHMRSYIDMYTKIPKNHVKYFPIDIPQLKSESFRVQHVKSLITYCKLELSPYVIEIARKWTPSNTSEKFTGVRSEFAQIKNDILQRKNLKKIKNIYSFEIDFLNSHKELKDSLYKLGYKDFIW